MTRQHTRGMISALAQAPGPETGTTWMVLERPDGLRLRIQASRDAAMLALVERLIVPERQRCPAFRRLASGNGTHPASAGFL